MKRTSLSSFLATHNLAPQLLSQEDARALFEVRRPCTRAPPRPVPACADPRPSGLPLYRSGGRCHL